MEKTTKFIDSGNDYDKEKAADAFAANMLLNPESNHRICLLTECNAIYCYRQVTKRRVY